MLSYRRLQLYVINCSSECFLTEGFSCMWCRKRKNKQINNQIGGREQSSWDLTKAKKKKKISKWINEISTSIPQINARLSVIWAERTYGNLQKRTTASTDGQKYPFKWPVYFCASASLPIRFWVDPNTLKCTLKVLLHAAWILLSGPSNVYRMNDGNATIFNSFFWIASRH